MNTWNADDFERFGTLGIGSGGFGTLFTDGFNTVARLMANGLETNQRFMPEGTEELIRFFKKSVTVNLGKTVTQIKEIGNNYNLQLIGPDGKQIGDNTYFKVIWATNLRAMSMNPVFAPIIKSATSIASTFSQDTLTALNNTHISSSSKLFLRTKSFWTGKTNFPRVILSDTGFQQAYTLDYEAAPTPESPGIVLISYTWEDNSTQSMALSAVERFNLFKQQIEIIHPDFAAALVPFTDDLSANLMMIDWQKEPFQYGAFALNQAGQDIQVQQLFFDYLKANDLGPPHVDRGPTGVFLAGDGVSWCGGWVESALQTGLNAAAAVIKSLGDATFTAKSSTPMDLKKENYQYNYTSASVKTGVPVKTNASIKDNLL